MSDSSHNLDIDESSFLLYGSHQGRRIGEKLLLVCLSLILVVGVSIGTYLLCVEGDTPAPAPKVFYFESRDNWDSQSTHINVSKLLLPTHRLLIVATNSTGCRKTSECITELKKLKSYQVEQCNELDIRYNFIVGGDGRIYEGRGWDYVSSYTDDHQPILAIAFLGRYDEFPPTKEQRNELNAFLDYAVMKNNLIPCYKTLVRNLQSRYIMDVALDIEKDVRKDYRCLTKYNQR